MTVGRPVGSGHDDPCVRRVGWSPLGARADTVILVGDRVATPGGRSMRWRALRHAIGATASCQLWELGCDRWSHCFSACAQPGGGGGPGGVDGVRSMPAPTGDQLGPWYYEKTFCRSHLRRLTEELTAAGTSTVICSGLESARYVTALAASAEWRVVFDLHNVEAPLHSSIRDAARGLVPYGQLYTDQHADLVALAEREALSAADQTWVCSTEDRDLVARHYGEAVAARTWVVPNTVDVPTDAPPPPRDVESVCFTGTMDYLPNHLAAKTLAFDIAPRLARFAPALPVVIAGMRADKWADAVGDPLPASVLIRTDPPDVSDIVRGSVMVIPLRIGGGSRFKILEAFALGAPVVSTTKGAEGLDLVPGRHYLAAEEAADFAGAVETLVKEPEVRAALVHEGWLMARDRYSAPALVRAVDTALRAR